MVPLTHSVFEAPDIAYKTMSTFYIHQWSLAIYWGLLKTYTKGHLGDSAG